MTARARFPIAPGDTVTAWELGPLHEVHFPGAVTRGTDTVDYVFINGFVDVGDLPCRTALRADIATRPTPRLQPFAPVALNLPGFDRKLDFSHFWHRPHRLSRWARTRLLPPGPGPARFELATCGGVHVWVDGVHVLAFEPYTRNSPRRCTVDLPLRPDGSELVVLLEDMAERDTSFFLELTWQGPGLMQAELDSSADPGALIALMDLARSLRPAAISFDGTGPLILRLDEPAPMDVEVAASVGQSVHLSHQPPLFEARRTLRAGQTELSLGQMTGLREGYHPLALTLSVGAARVERRIAFALLRQTAPRPLPGDLPARKAAALAHAGAHGEDRMGRVLALLAMGQPLDARAVGALEDTLQGVETRRDCSDFVMVPLLWAFGAHGAALPDALHARTRAAILSYRYWLDEPGNDTMWFWSENHVLCFHVSEYLAGRILPDDIFPNSGLTGAQHLAQATARLRRWFDSVEAHGLAEWNSAAYYPIDFIGLFALRHWATGEIRARATDLLDRLFEMIGLHCCNGVPAGSMGRAYDKELRAGPLNELAPIAAVAFGHGWLNGGVAALPMFCLSDYAPPDAARGFAAPAPDTALSARYVQGHGAAARLALFKTDAVQMSAAVDGAAGQQGHQQHLVDVQMAARPFARVWVNHPGDEDPWGDKRPSYWAGNGLTPRVGMTGNRALLLSHLPAGAALAFTHAYAPLGEFDTVRQGPDWMVLCAGSGAVILKATGRIRSLTQGPGAGLEHRLQGPQGGWAVLALDARPGLAGLCARAEALRLTLSDARRPRLDLYDPDDLPLALDLRDGLSVDGRPHPFETQETRPHVTIQQTAPVLPARAR